MTRRERHGTGGLLAALAALSLLTLAGAAPAAAAGSPGGSASGGPVLAGEQASVTPPHAASSGQATSPKPNRPQARPQSGRLPVGVVNGGGGGVNLVQDNDFADTTGCGGLDGCADAYWSQYSQGGYSDFSNFYNEQTGWDDGASQYTADLCGYMSCADDVEQSIVVPYDITAASMNYLEGAMCPLSACGGSGVNVNWLQVGLWNDANNTGVAPLIYLPSQAAGYVQDPPESWGLDPATLLSWLQANAGQTVDVLAEAATAASDTTEWFVTDIDLDLTLGNTAVSTDQYLLPNSDGSTWQVMDDDQPGLDHHPGQRPRTCC